MNHFRRNKVTISFALVLIIVSTMLPLQVYGEVQKVTELENTLSGISEEEKLVLEELFKLEQEIGGMEQEERLAAAEIEKRELQVQNLESQVQAAQGDYNLQLNILKQVLVDYQRRGPASYLEILLNAKNLSEFLASLNIIKDITHNVKDLLVTIEDSKVELENQRDALVDQKLLLEKSREKLQEKIKTKEELQEEREIYLASLQGDRAFYEEQLNLITQMWADCTTLFPDIAKELKEIIEAGYFTLDDLNIAYSLFSIQGYISQEVFHQILAENTTLTQTVFRFQEEKIVIDVPDKNLSLVGNFVVDGDMAIRFEVTEGTFFDLPLETTSLQELFINEPFILDFGAITGDMLMIDFTLSEVWSQEGALNFIIIPDFGDGGSHD